MLAFSKTVKRRAESWLRLRALARSVASRRRPALAFLAALALMTFAPSAVLAFAIAALVIPALPIMGLSISGLTVLR